MSWQQFLMIASAHFLALLSPGPDFFLLLNHSLAHGRGAGYRTALGIACANGAFIVAALCGVTWLYDYPLVYGVVYWIGCAYLAWLALQFWRARPLALRRVGTEGCDQGFFVRGLLSGMLNPKNALFYLTLFTVLSGEESGEWWRGLAGLWMFAAVLAWDILVCWLVTQPGMLAAFDRRQTLVNRASAGLLSVIVGGMLCSSVPWR